MCSDMTLINEREGRPKKLDKVNQGGALVDTSLRELIQFQKCVNGCQCQVLTKVISLGKEVMCVSQGIYIQQDQVSTVTIGLLQSNSDVKSLTILKLFFLKFLTSLNNIKYQLYFI